MVNPLIDVAFAGGGHCVVFVAVAVLNEQTQWKQYVVQSCRLVAD